MVEQSRLQISILGFRFSKSDNVKMKCIESSSRAISSDVKAHNLIDWRGGAAGARRGALSLHKGPQHVDHEAISDVRLEQSLVRLVNLAGLDFFDDGCDVVLAAEVQHFLGFLHTANS